MKPQEKIYAVLFEVPSQRPIIERVCFGSCGKILVGSIAFELTTKMQFGVVPCLQSPEACPALDKDSTEAVPTLDGANVYLRKLKEPRS